MQVNRLSPQARAIFEDISKLDCIKDYCLIGGTALALQIDHRRSDDFDFCIWKKHRNDTVTINWSMIFKELSSIGEVKHNILGFDHYDFYLNGQVKITFFGNDTKEPENMQKIRLHNNIVVADPASIGVLKLDVMQYRSTHRDYYDLYSLLQMDISLESLISRERKYSRYHFKTRNIVSLLVNGSIFLEDRNFAGLEPKYNVSIKDIENFMTEKVKELTQITI